MEISDVEFEILRLNISTTPAINPIYVLAGQPQPPPPVITQQGRYLKNDDIKVIVNIMIGRGNVVSRIEEFIEMIEESLDKYTSFEEWESDPLRPKGPMSILECVRYSFRAKKYNQSRNS